MTVVTNVQYSIFKVKYKPFGFYINIYWKLNINVFNPTI